MKKAIFLLFWFTGMLYGTIEVSGAGENVPNGGIHVVGGSVSILFPGNDFPDASPEAPVYLRLRYDENIRLTETLVDPTSEDPVLSAPIFFPLRLIFDEGAEMIAPADTVSIVDWREGRREIWLR